MKLTMRPWFSAFRWSLRPKQPEPAFPALPDVHIEALGSRLLGNRLWKLDMFDIARPRLASVPMVSIWNFPILA